MSDRELMAEAVVSATREVFGTMLEMEAEPCQIDAGVLPDIGDSVVAALGLTGSWTGSGTMTFDAAFASEIAARLLLTGDAETGVNNEVLDAVSEIANMVIGNTKTILEDALGPLGMSIPIVIYGRNFRIRSACAVKETRVRFQAAGHDFDVHLRLFPSSSARPHAPMHDMPFVVGPP